MQCVTIIVAVATNGVIGRAQQLPWKLRSDLQRFKRITMGHALLMGRKTFESIGRILPGRTSIVITRQVNYHPEGVLIASSIESAIQMTLASQTPFVIGGGEIFRLAMPYCRRILLTRVLSDIEGDARFDCWTPESWQCVGHEQVPAGPHDEYATVFEEWTKN